MEKCSICKCEEYDGSICNDCGFDHSRDEAVEISPDELQSCLDSGKSILMLDVRTQEEYDLLSIPDSKLIPFPSVHLVYDDFDRESRTVVISQKGGRSSLIANFLRQKGFDACYLRGGLDLFIRKARPDLAAEIVADENLPE